jgi:hypothetical protein
MANKYEGLGLEPLKTAPKNKYEGLGLQPLGEAGRVTGLLSPTEDKEIAEAITSAENWPQAKEGALKHWLGIIKEGWKQSVTGMMYHGEVPQADKERTFAERLIRDVVTGAVDMPYYLAGLALGGGVTPTGVGGSMALPAGVRKVLMDRYEKGEVKDVKEFTLRAVGALTETMKGQLAGSAGIMAGGLVTPALKVPTEAVTMTAVQGLLEGRIPTLQEFTDTAAVMAAMGIGMKVAGQGVGKVDVARQEMFKKKLMKTYEKTGVLPDELYQMAKKDPTIMADMVSKDKQFPRRFLEKSIDEKVIKEAPKSEKGALKEARDKFVQDWVEKLDPLQQWTEQVAGKKVARGLAVVENPYKAARLLAGLDGQITHFFEYGGYNLNTLKNNSKPLKAILRAAAEVEGGKIDGFRQYAIARRAMELEAQGRTSGFEHVDKAALIKAGDTKYKKHFQDLVDFQNSSLKQLRDAGIIDSMQFEAMLEKGQSYVPMKRAGHKEKGFALAQGLEAEKPLRYLRGSEKPVLDPFQEMVGNTIRNVAMANRNKVAQAIVEFGKKFDPEGRHIRRIEKKTPQEQILKKIVGSEELAKWAEEMGITKDNALGANKTMLEKGKIVVWENGKRSYYEIAPEVADAFHLVGAETASRLYNNFLLSGTASMLRAGATLAPEFWMRNVIRDVASSFVYSKHGALPHFGADFVKGIFHTMKRGEMYQEWLKGGGAQAMMVSLDKAHMNKMVYHELLNSRVHNVVRHPMEFLRLISETTEQATRIGEFALVKKVSGKRGLDRRAAAMEAGFEARDITLDFAKSGHVGKQVNMISAFFNARIQGYAKLWDTFKTRPVAATMKALVAITAPSIMLAIKNHGDPDIAQIPRWQKDLFWLMKVNGVVYRIPKPFELGILFGTIPERIAEHILSKGDTKAWEDFMGTLGNELPIPAPTGLMPVVENITGYSFFRDRSLIPIGAERKLPEYQYGVYSSELAKGVSRIIGSLPGMDQIDKGYSAIEIENLIAGWTGGLGRHAVDLLDYAGRKMGVLDDPIKPTKTLSDIPLVKAFVARHPSSQAESIEKFRRRWEHGKKVIASANGLRKEFKFLEAANLITESDFNALDTANNALRQMNDTILTIHHLPSMDGMTKKELADWKRETIDKLYYDMIEIAKFGNHAWDQLQLHKAELNKALKAIDQK